MPPDRYLGRTLMLYFPTIAEFQEMKNAAEVAGLPYAHYAREMIRTGMKFHQIEPDIEALNQSTQAREELTKCKRELKDKTSMIEKLETELFTLKHSLFLQPSPTGDGQLSSELVDLLQDGHVWRSDEIMKSLQIDQKNIDAIKVLAGQLRALQDLKMIEETSRGWKWIK